MVKRPFSLFIVLGRLVKIAVVAVALPFGIVLLGSLLGHVDVITIGQTTAKQWLIRGGLAYAVLHLILWRPRGLFRVNQRMFSVLAVWLFGGPVASTEGAGGKAARAARAERAGGSTLVAFSPYVIPLYAILACLAGSIGMRWVDRALLEAPVLVLIGLSLTFHWLMSADELQAERGHWHLETYLLAVAVIFVLTQLLVAACLPLVLPGFSWMQAVGEALAGAGAFYASLWQQMFL